MLVPFFCLFYESSYFNQLTLRLVACNVPSVTLKKGEELVISRVFSFIFFVRFQALWINNFNVLDKNLLHCLNNMLAQFISLIFTFLFKNRLSLQIV